MGHGVTGLVVALILTALALPPLLARLTGGHPPTRITQLAALAPIAVVPATAAVIIAAATAGWPAAPLAVPAAILWIWQLPRRKKTSHQAGAGSSRESGAAPPALSLRVLTINALGGAADPAAILRMLQSHNVDVLAVQELTARMVSRLAAAGLEQLLPFSHLDPRPASPGTGLWARWPLTPLPPVPGLTAAAPRARIDPPGGAAGHADRRASARANARARRYMAAGAGADPADCSCGRWAAGGGWGLQRQPGPPPVPGSPGGRVPGLRGLQPAPVLAGIHLAGQREDAARHAPGSCAGLTDRHGPHGPRHPSAPY